MGYSGLRSREGGGLPFCKEKGAMDRNLSVLGNFSNKNRIFFA